MKPKIAANLDPKTAIAEMRRVADEIEAELNSGKKPSRDAIASQLERVVTAVSFKLDRRVEHDVSMELDRMYPDIVANSGHLSEEQQKIVDEEISALWEFFDERAESAMKQVKLVKKLRKFVEFPKTTPPGKIPFMAQIREKANAADRAVYEAEAAHREVANMLWSAARAVEYWIYNTEDE
jgi:hypothetical protein